MIGRRVPLRLQGQLAAFFLSLAFLLWANLETPFWGDDYCRMVDSSIVKAVLRSWKEYFDWTGRFFTDVITFVVMGSGRQWGPVWFDVFNSLVFVGLIWVVSRLAKLASGRDGDHPDDLLIGFTDTIFVALMLWWLPRTVGEVALWKTGAIGYLWPVTGELLILERCLSGRVLPLWLVPFAFVIATFLEPLSLLITCVIGVLGFLRWRHHTGSPIRLIAVATAHAAGTLFVCAAPGNFARASTVAPSPPMDRVVGVLGNIGSLFDGYWAPFLIVIAIAFLVSRDRPQAVASYRLGPDQHHSRAQPGWRAGRGWMFPALALVYMLLLLSVPRSALAARISFPASVLLICYLASVFRLRLLAPRFNQLMAAVMLLLIVLHGMIVVPGLRQIAGIDRGWTATLKPFVGSGADVVLPLARINGRTLYVRKSEFFEGISGNPDYFVNVCYARAMGVRTITGR